MNSILITGCNRGLGLGLVKCLVSLPKPPKHLFATVRNIDQAEELNKLAEQHRNIHILQIDLKDFDRYDTLVKEVENIVEGNGLNVLFNNAGISPKSTRLPFVKVNDLMNTYVTNTVAPIMLTKAFLPLLKKAAHMNSSGILAVEKACIINMSSILGSLQGNVEGGLYPYRVTKAGVNMATKSMSIDLKGNEIVAVSIHPGWVKTDMGGSNASLDVDTSCKNIIHTIFSLKPEDTGKFLQHDGKELPW